MSLVLSNSTYVQFALGAIVILISLVLLRRGRRSRLNEPPLVPYKYPIIGHTIDYYKDNKALIKKCQENYGEIFSLYVFGKVITIVGKGLTSEVFKNHQTFDFADAQSEVFPMNEFMRRPNDFLNGVAKVVQANLSGKLVHYTERVQRQLIKSVDNLLGDSKVVEPPMKFFQFIVAKPIAATLIGEELSEDKELVNSFAYATNDLSPFLAIPPIFSFIHPTLHTKLVVFAFRYLHNPYKMHRELIKHRITPVIEKRLSEMKKLGDSYTPPIDILQKYIESCSKDYVADIEAITDYIIAIVFASVHTTSRTLTYCIQEFVNHPQFQKEILDELEQLHKTCGSSYYSIEQIAKLEKLDSLIRESLRFHSQSVALQHKIIASSFTFSNGYQVPKGRVVYIREEEIHFDEELQGQNPNEFGPFRHLNGSHATRIEKNYIAFGLGKHACPGRFFAINEIKMALNYILLNYNIRKVDEGKIYPITFGPYKSPSNEGLIFEKKK